MRNQGRSRRSRGQKDNDEDQFTAREEPHAAKASYTRHHTASRYSETHRNASATSSRMVYDNGRDRNAESSRNIRDDGWGKGAVGHDRFDYGSYHHAEHDSYDTPARRELESWRGNGEAQYSSRGDWTASYHQSEPSTSYPEASNWNTATTPNPYSGITPPAHTARSMNSPFRTPNTYYEGSRSPAYESARSYYHEADQWSQREAREPLPEDRIDPNPTEKARNTGWKKDTRREKGAVQQKFQSDSGWSTRKKGKEWITAPQPRWDEPPPDRQDTAHTEDRSWEPAESWKSGNRTSEPTSSKQQPSHREGGRSSHRSSKQLKASRRTQQPNKSKRDWRTEDINLNNWTRRDVSASSKKSNEKQSPSSSRRKHPRSQSRSRSRSIESHRSARSSYAHSRSRSSSPVAKRRRREASPAARSHSPGERDRSGWAPPPREEERRISRSPSPFRSPPVYLRRSPTYSDMSSQRSRSRSPAEKRRAVHRLPAIPAAQAAAGPSTAGEKKNRKGKKNRNSQTQASRNAENKRQRYPDPDQATIEIGIPMMPPPPVHYGVGLARDHEPQLVQRQSKMPYQPQPPSQPESAPRIAPIRNVGIKPIVKPNSALKRFFPGDDEDSEAPDDISRHPRDHRLSSPALAPFYHPPPHDGLNGHYEQNGSSVPYPARVLSEQAKATWQPPAHLGGLDNGYAKRFESLNLPPAPPALPIPSSFADSSKSWPSHTVPSWLPQSVPPRPTFPHEPAILTPQQTPSWFAQEVSDAQAAEVPLQSVPEHSGRDDSSNEKSQRAKEKEKEQPPRIPTPPVPSSAKPPPVASDYVEPRAKSSTSHAKELYMIINQVGEGTFGKVYKAQNTASNMYVALKRIRMETERDGFPVTAMREIKLLQSLKHQNVVRLYEMMVSNGSVFMVFEYMDHDLTGILSQTQFKFTNAHLKSLCHQMLAGLAYLHHKGVIHRDIKGSNILLNNRGELKLADFGLARFYQKRRRSDYTNRVITLWYRPPELLFGATIYGAEVDMWSAGCIMLELFTKKPVFQGNDEIHQLHVVFKIFGTPTPDRWMGLLNLPWYELVKPREVLPNRFRELFQKWMSPAALDLAERLLTYDPSQRVSAQAAMEAPYFTQESPLAERPTGLSTLEGEWHELETKVERQKKRKKTENTVA